MKFWPILLMSALIAGPMSAQQSGAKIDPQLAETLSQSLLTATSSEPSAGTPDVGSLVQVIGRQLYDQAILIEGQTDGLIAEFERRLEMDQIEPAEHIALLRLQTAVLQRRGDLTDALKSIDAELELEKSGTGLFQRGQTLDSLERRADALTAYSEALELLSADDPRVVTLMLRRAMLSMEGDTEAKDALAEFAASDACDTEMRNRAAVVLALLGRPQDAIDLYQVEGEGSKLFRQQIRMAEWALKADQAEAAQQWAWKARGSAELRRDRFYALTVLSEAHRLDDSLDQLLESFAGADQLDLQSHQAWIALLRETGEYDTAVAMFEKGSAETGFSNSSRRELLEMYREAGRSDEMIQQYRFLMESDPDNVLWPEGLSRFYLEQGKTQAARELWDYFLVDAEPGLAVVAAAEALMGLGQDDLAIRCAERCIEAKVAHFAALQFLFDMHRLRGELELAAEVLERTDQLAPIDSPARMQLAESFERIGDLQRAVDVLEELRDARAGVPLSEDLEMRLAWLHSEVGNEELALERWRNLWLKVNSIPRRRYVEDRMMSVASRLGKLADIAIELEGRLFAGEADERDSGLLVRLYTRVGDPVSATEIIEEFLKQSGGSEIAALEEKARVFMSCNDYHNYERAVRSLIEVNPEGEAEYLQQIAMSMLERGKPDQARTILARLKELESDAASAEFEAGVLALAGMEKEAITAYRRGLANNPDRIESYLMMAALMQQIGQKNRAIGMFQDTALNAERDDLFIIAIDGLLNLNADNGIMSWARRITLERLARRHEKVYLYQLLADLGEQVEDKEARIAALQGSLAIAGDRRVSVVRELMDLSTGRNNSMVYFGPQNSTGGDKNDRQLNFGRRLIGLGQIVPPQVYLDLGRTFLSRGAISDASKTFRLARDLPDYDVFQSDVGLLFEQNGFLNQALEMYRKVLIGDSTNVGLLVKVGELQEQLQDDPGAANLYLRAVELLLARRPLVTGDQEGESTEKFSYWAARNVDDFDKYFERAANGLLVTNPESQIDDLLASHLAVVDQEITEAVAMQPTEADPLPINRYPRLFRRSHFVRRLALSYGRAHFAAEMDHRLLAAFPDDDQMLERMVKQRIKWGLNSAAHRLLLESGRPAAEIDQLLWLIGKGVAAGATELVPIDEALRLLLPMMTNQQYDDARLLLRRVDFGGVEASRSNDAGALYSASAIIGDQDLSLFLGRNWLRLMTSGDNSANSYTVGPVISRIALSLNDELRRSFFQYFIQLILDDTDKLGSLLSLLPEIQKQVADPLIEQEELVKLINEKARIFAYNLGPLLQLAPEETRVGLASTVWVEISPTMRVYFLFNLMAETVGPLGGEMDDQIIEWLKQLLEEDDIAQFNYRMDQLTTDESLESNPVLVRRVIETFTEVKPDAIMGKFAQLKLFMYDKLEDQAVDLALDVYFSPEVQDRSKWEFSQARYYVDQTMFPLAPERFLERFTEEAKGKTQDLEQVNQRLQLVNRLNDQDLYMQELQLAVAQLPDERGLQEQLYYRLNSAKKVAEADALFEQMLEHFPNEQLELAQTRFRAWRVRGNAIVAVDALHMLQEVQAKEDAEPEPEEREPGTEKLTRASIYEVKKAVEADDFDEASNLLRRMWRTFQVGDQRFFYFGNPSWARANWPATAKKEEDYSEEEKAKRAADRQRSMRGGLDAYREPEERKNEQQNAWEVLATYPFGVEEMERFLRSNGPKGLENYTAIIDGLAVARGLQSNPDLAVKQLIDKVNSGEAIKVEVLQLLSMLQKNPESLPTEAQQVLDDLTNSLNPRDGNQLLRLAGVMAAIGARDRALDLYRWCATQTSASSYFSYRQEEFGSIPVGRLVEEMRANLDKGDDMVAIIEQALTLATPGDNPWEQVAYQRLVLDTWIGLLEPGEALERTREICAKADTALVGRWNTFSDTAAWLYAHENELDRAMECLEFYLDPAQRRSNYYYRSLDQNKFPRFFPEDASGWKDSLAWLNRIGPAMLQWVRDDVLKREVGLRATALVVVRLYEQGDLEHAEQLMQELAEMNFADDYTDLWIVDAARRIGYENLATSLEWKLFEADKLNTTRTIEVLERMAAAGDTGAVLAYGEKVVEQRRPKLIMDLMLRVATDQLDEAAMQVWTERIAATAAAAEELKAYYEAEREKNQNQSIRFN
jgi:DNA-binding SARP family transcriptional activator